MLGARALAMLALAAAQAAAQTPSAPVRLPIAEFSAMTPDAPLPPAGWRAQHFRGVEKHTRYSLTSDEGRTVLRAEAKAGASGLVRRIEADLAATPLLAWRWKLVTPVRLGDPKTKAGDDYPARVYVTFRYSPGRPGSPGRFAAEVFRLSQGDYPPHATLVYVWDARQPAGTVRVNPFTDRARMIVARGAGDAPGVWRVELRDVLADYRRVFGEEPPPVSGVALMTDTDNTGDAAEALYGDIELRAN